MTGVAESMTTGAMFTTPSISGARPIVILPSAVCGVGGTEGVGIGIGTLTGLFVGLLAGLHGLRRGINMPDVPEEGVEEEVNPTWTTPDEFVPDETVPANAMPD